ncbi:MAG: hypothetical protein IV085_09640 [Thiobacillus sp.]|nr:hypothetical protein [Thiobacillus sp.]
MKPGIRSFSTLIAIVALIMAGLSFWAGQKISMAGKTAEAAREVTFKSYRIAQSLKALAAGYELTMNEFYSTVLTYPVYREKSAAQKIAIESELAALEGLHQGDTATVVELTQRFREMENFRQELDSALTRDEQDWDRAREALYKLNVLSVQAIQQADFLGRSASERATSLDSRWQAQQSQSILLLNVVTALAALVGVLLVFSALRAGRT